MPTTTNGLPYPSSSSAANVPLDLQNLAEAVDPLAADSSWTAITVGAGWGGTACYWRRLGKTIYLRGEIHSGSVGSTNIIFTLPVAARPPRRQSFPISRYHGSAGAAASIQIDTDGKAHVLTLVGSVPGGSPGYVLDGCDWLVD